jgi:RNA polymerase sigma factor (sigma-70 family)
MTDISDADLLQQYARDHSGAAFTALVERHINLVHSVAFRQTNNQQHAEDITQAVFIILARKASSLGHKTILPGWLYHTARLTAANFQRSENRRIHREQEAYMQSTIPESAPDLLWTELCPLLDQAMSQLGAHDRDALVLRYFQKKSLAEVGATMGLEERTAQKRIHRALEKLRGFFGKRGVDSTAESIAIAISAHSIQAAPAALAKSVATVAVYKGATATLSTLTLVNGVLRLMTWQKMKLTAVTMAAVILAAGTTAMAVDHSSPQKNTSFSFPYSVADDYWKVISGLDTNKLVVRVYLTSNNKAARPQDNYLTIHSAIKGPIPVHLSTNGQLLDFPHDESLRRENPPVTFSQPHGNVSFWCYTPPPQGLSFQYSQLVGGITEMKEAIVKLNKLMTPSDLGWIGYLEWLFSPNFKVNENFIIAFPVSSANKATVEILAASGTKTYTANSAGRVRLKLDNALLKENPSVRLSQKPLFIAPNMSK